MLLSQGSNFQTQLQKLPKSTHTVAPSANSVRPRPKPLNLVLPPSPPVTPTWTRPTAPTNATTPIVPSIASFTASKHTLQAGDVVTLSWKVEGVRSVNISNIGTVDADGHKIIKASDFEGITEFELIVRGSPLKRTVTIEFPVSLAKMLTQWSIPAIQPIHRTSLPTAPTASIKPVKPRREYGKFKVFAVLGIIATIILALSGLFSSGYKAAFVPNQQRGLELFEQGKFDSSYVNLVGFSNDTSYNFATQYNLAYMYDFGEGTLIDDTLAVSLYGSSMIYTDLSQFD